MLHASTMTVVISKRSEVAIWQLRAAALTATHLGLSHRSEERILEAKVWVWTQCSMLGFRGPSMELPRTSCAQRCFSDSLPEWSQEDMLLKTF